MTIQENIELRLILTPEDPLYKPFTDIKTSLGIRSNTEVIRFIIKQISKIPISTLILDFMKDFPDLIKEQISTENEVQKDE